MNQRNLKKRQDELDRLEHELNSPEVRAHMRDHYLKMKIALLAELKVLNDELDKLA